MEAVVELGQWIVCGFDEEGFFVLVMWCIANVSCRWYVYDGKSLSQAHTQPASHALYPYSCNTLLTCISISRKSES